VNGSIDVAIVRADAGVAPTDVATALANGGRLAVHAGEALPDWKNALNALGFETSIVEDAGQEPWLSATKPGSERPLPSGLGRGSSVNRSNIRDAVETPLFRAPDAVTLASDAQVAIEAKTLRAQFDAQIEAGTVDLAKVTFPRSVSAASLEGPPNADVLAVFAHPDDESIFAGGTLAKLAQAGQKVTLAVATDAAGGRSGTTAERYAELAEASRTLGVQLVTSLELPDTGKYVDQNRSVPLTSGQALRQWSPDAILERLVRAIRTQRPQTVLTFDSTRDPNYSLHGHHLAVGAATTIAVKLAADPSSFPEHLSAGLKPWAAQQQFAVVPSGVEGAIAVEGLAASKSAALGAYASQTFSIGEGSRQDASMGAAAMEYWHLVQRQGTQGGALNLEAIPQKPHADLFITPTPLPGTGVARWLVNGEARAGEFYEMRGAEAVAQTIGTRTYHRAVLGEVMRNQNAAAGAGPKTFENIERLEHDPRTVAIVTGQQVGLGGGPLYTLYKALGAVHFAQTLSNRGTPAVPILWMATYDHDLAEVATLRGFSEAGQVKRWQAKPTKLKPAVGAVRLGADGAQAAQTLIDQYAATLPSEDVATLKEMFRADLTYAESFGRFMAWLSHATGLILLDPTDPRLARLGAPLIEKELFGETSSSLHIEEANARLKREGFEPGVESAQTDGTTSLNVFWIDEGGNRVKLSRNAAGEFLTEGTPSTLSREQVRRMLAEQPERFTPTALLRPAYEDTMLPTASYVGGPAELQYYAQTKGVYEWAGVPMPQVSARPSFTVARGTVVRDIAANAGHFPLKDGTVSVDAKRLTRSIFPPGVLQAYGMLALAAQEARAVMALIGRKLLPEEVAKATSNMHALAKKLALQLENAQRQVGNVSALDDKSRERLIRGLQAAGSAPALLETWAERMAATNPGELSGQELRKAAEAIEALEPQLDKVGRSQRAAWFAELFQLQPEGQPQERQLSILELVGKHGGRQLVTELLPLAVVAEPKR
jgi:bacillithiol biosynthesis cysteine-adding enzyme BshC